MKTRKKNPHLSVYKPGQSIYPNGADNSYFAERALNIITAIVSGIGFVSAMLFLVTMA